MAMPDSDSGSGSAGSLISLRVTKRDVSPSCGPFPHQRIVTVSFSPPYVGFSKNWFVVSTKLLVGDDVVVATESVAAASWIADVSMVQQLEKTFRLYGQQLAVRRLRWSSSKRQDS